MSRTISAISLASNTASEQVMASENLHLMNCRKWSHRREKHENTG